MDVNKDIRAVFGIPIHPNVTGTWESLAYPISIEITQPSQFDSTLSGSMTFGPVNGTTLIYSVTGYNRPPHVYLSCNRNGYYEIEYSGWYANDNLLEGGFTENNIYYPSDLVRNSDFPMPGNRIPFAIHKIPD
jgi:hypothetical protein